MARKNKTYYSQSNKERLKWLWEHNLIHPKVQKEIEKVVQEEFYFSPDIIDRIKQDEIVWEIVKVFRSHTKEFVSAILKRQEFVPKSLIKDFHILETKLERIK